MLVAGSTIPTSGPTHVLGPSRAHPIVLIVGGLALSLVVLYELPRAAPEQVPWVWVGAGAFGAASLLGVLLLAANRPRLVLGHDFLEYKTPFRTHRWRWEDVGACEVSEKGSR